MKELCTCPDPESCDSLSHMNTVDGKCAEVAIAVVESILESSGKMYLCRGCGQYWFD